MTLLHNRQIVLAARPMGLPQADNFRLTTSVVPTPGPGQVLLRTLYLSLDPYMRSLMGNAKADGEPVELGQPMPGATVSRVEASQYPGLAVGDVVASFAGWQDYAVADGAGLRQLASDALPVSTALGVLGLPGLSAYVGLLTFGQPQAGETVVVSAATGAVGSVAGQLAKIKGARVVGIAGGPEKVAYLLNELGFDAAVDHRAPDFAAQLRAACPAGIDVDFENVGGAVFEAVLPLLNEHARVVVCGVVAQYNQLEAPAGPNQLPGLLDAMLWKRLSLRGFSVSHHLGQQQEFVAAATGWLQTGQLRYREDIVEGLENAAQAFPRLFHGGNFGKLLVKVAD